MLKRLLELDGFSVNEEDECNWALGKDGLDDVVMVPKIGLFVAAHVVQAVFRTAGICARPYLFTARSS